jgi:hypothetical protein
MRRVEKIIECKFCQSNFVVSVDVDAYERWQNGEGFIQDLMPDMSPSERELLISQTCDDCFDAIFLGITKEDESVNG